MHLAQAIAGSKIQELFAVEQQSKEAEVKVTTCRQQRRQALDEVGTVLSPCLLHLLLPQKW